MANEGRTVEEMRLEIQLATLRSHERHMLFIYGVRILALVVAAVSIVAGAWMVFRGLQGTFNWAVESPHTLSSKLTNASPGIGFAMVGMIITFIVILQKPVNYTTDSGDEAGKFLRYYVGIGPPPSRLERMKFQVKRIAGMRIGSSRRRKN